MIATLVYRLIVKTTIGGLKRWPTEEINMPTIEDQMRLEHEMVQAGIDRYNAAAEKLRSKGQGSKTTYGRTIVAGVVAQVSEAVAELQKKSASTRNCVARKKLQGMDAEQVAYLALLAVVDSVSLHASLLKVARTVGMFVEDQYRLEQWVKEEGEFAKNVLRVANEKNLRSHKRRGLNHKLTLDGQDATKWSNEERLFVGIRLIDVIIVETGLVRLQQMRTSKNKVTTFVEATPETLEWIKKLNEYQSSRRHRYAPCIIPPKDWEGVWGGGYYDEIINALPLVRTH